MRIKLFCVAILSIIFLTLPPPLPSVTSDKETDSTQQQDKFIQSLASLTCYLDELHGELEENPHKLPEDIIFTEESVDILWKNIASTVCTESKSNNFNVLKDDFTTAFSSYSQGKKLLGTKQFGKKAKKLIKKAGSAIDSIWDRSLKLAKKKAKSASKARLMPRSLINKSITNSFESNPYIISRAKNEMRPHIIPDDHPMLPVLDSIFLVSRVTVNLNAFNAAGFVTVGEARPRSFIRVARHEALPGYLVKISLDDELRKKFGKPSWKWLEQRCVGAKKIKKIIQDRKIKHFTVAEKWIYPLPAEPSPPINARHTRHLAILLVTDMQLVPEIVNLHAWGHCITKKHLDELYCIISYAKGSSYRPDNICYTVNKNFTFIDTEYPNTKPDFRRIRSFLNPKMRSYWDKLVKNGGK